MSSASSSSSARERAQVLPVLPPFSASNFALWCMQAFAVFAVHDLLEVVETDCASAAVKEERDRAGVAKREATHSAASGAAVATAAGQQQASSTAAAASASPPVSKDKDVQRSRRAYGALMMSLKDVQLQLCQHVPLGDAHGVWRVLLDNYDRRSVATRVQLIERFFSMEQARGERVSVYVSRVTEVAFKLAEQGEKLSDTMQLFVLLRGVTRSFPTLVTLLKMKENLTFQEAVEAIRNEEERSRMDEKRNGSNEVSFFSREVRGKEQSAGDRRCHECNEKGHLRHSCPKIKCHRCDRNGHLAAHCRAVYPAKKKGGREEEEEDKAMIATMQANLYESEEEEDEWYA